MKRNKTYSAKPYEIPASWHVIDAEGQVLGRLCSQISRTLQGKHKAAYTPHVLTGDYVVVINASKIRVTGKKLLQKTYYRHSGYTGNLKSTILRDMLEDPPGQGHQAGRQGHAPRHQARTRECCVGSRFTPTGLTPTRPR